MSNQVSASASNADNPNKKKRRGLWWKIPLCLIAALIVLAIIGASNTPNLRIERGRGGFESMISIQNTGTQELTITKIDVNNRDDCRIPLKDFPLKLKVGDETLLNAGCPIVRLNIVTSNGSATYTFP